MAEAVKFVAGPRAGRGSHQSRQLRRTGQVPAVLYGHKELTLALAVDGVELEKAIRRGVRVIDLVAGGKEEKALIKDVQWDHLGKELLHIDFARVSLDERIVVTVHLEIRGNAPG